MLERSSSRLRNVCLGIYSKCGEDGAGMMDAEVGLGLLDYKIV